jgi:hypothetical protein
VLPSISRSITLKLAEDLGIPAEETNITPEEALRCEMFCTATSFCVLPFRTLDRARLGSECPGPLTRQLMDAWRQHVGLDFVSQARQYAEVLQIGWRRKTPLCGKSHLTNESHRERTRYSPEAPVLEFGEIVDVGTKNKKSDGPQSDDC